MHNFNYRLCRYLFLLFSVAFLVLYLLNMAVDFMTYLQSEVRSSPEVKLLGDPEFPRCFRPSNCASSDALLHLQKEKRKNQNVFDIMFKFDFSYLRKCNTDDLSWGFFFMPKISKSVILNSDFIKKS